MRASAADRVSVAFTVALALLSPVPYEIVVRSGR